MSSDLEESNLFDVPSDDEDDWEEVDVHQQEQQGHQSSEPAYQQGKAIEITLQPSKVKADADKSVVVTSTPYPAF